MSRVNAKLRRGETGYFHWCPGCEEMHPLPDGWQFNGNLDSPTFSPSFLQTFVRWTGGVDEHGLGLGEKQNLTCHYILTDGVLHFQADCFHGLAGKSVPLPDLPTHLQGGDV